MKSVYEETYARSLADPTGFWAAAAEDLYWDRRWDRVFDDARPPYYRWFTGGMLNTCYNALDLHVDRGRGKQRALVYDSPVTDTIRVFTYAELRDAVARLAGALRRQGIAQGDRVIIYMPMVPEAVMAMLACARIGAVHSVVFGGFAPNELAKRIDDARPRLILSAAGGVRHRLGRRPQLHRLRAAAEGLHDDPLRGQARRHAGPRRVLAGHRRARCQRALHGADRVPRDQEGGSRGRAHGQARSDGLPH